MIDPHPLYLNAQDSLRMGIGHFLVAGENENGMKHAVLNVFHGLELLLKERLRREHHLLIYSKLEQPVTDDSHTVGLDETLARLANVDVKFTSEQLATLRELRRYRNRIEHHVYLPANDHGSKVAKALSFAYDFLPAHLDDSLEDIVDGEDTFRKIRDLIRTHEERLKEARDVIERRALLDKNTTQAAECPQCANRTIMIGSDRGDFCFYCREEFTTRECESCGQRCVLDLMHNDMVFEKVCEDCYYANRDRMDRD